MMYHAFKISRPRNQKKTGAEEENLDDVFSILYQMLKSGDNLKIYVSAWSIAWSGYGGADIIPHNAVAKIADQLAELWLADFGKGFNLKRVISWGMSSICLPKLKIQEREGLRETIEENFSNPQNDQDRLAAVHLALIMNFWSKEQVKEKLGSQEELEFSVRESRLLKELGIV